MLKSQLILKCKICLGLYFIRTPHIGLQGIHPVLCYQYNLLFQKSFSRRGCLQTDILPPSLLLSCSSSQPKHPARGWGRRCNKQRVAGSQPWTTSCQVGALGAVFWALRRPRWRPPRGPAHWWRAQIDISLSRASFASFPLCWEGARARSTPCPLQQQPQAAWSHTARWKCPEGSACPFVHRSDRDWASSVVTLQRPWRKIHTEMFGNCCLKFRTNCQEVRRIFCDTFNDTTPHVYYINV